MGTGQRPERNQLSGEVHGAVIQAGTIGQVRINEVPAELPVPFQLPPLPRSFTNRAQESSLIRQWIDDEKSGPRVTVISGPAGVGKTTLALRLLHDARDRFPDGQLYVDLEAFTPTGPTEPERVLEWFLLALGVSGRNIPFGLPGREALYRSLTSDRALAVLLDNAFSAAQVRPLLPASRAGVVLVTSRLRLAGLSLDGARFAEVDPLSVNDSVELLNNIVGSGRLVGEPGQTEELAQLCGGMPIALSVVGARLAAYPHRSASSELGNLRGDGRLAGLTLDGDSVEAIFDVSYAELPAQQARVYRMCSLHPGPVFGVAVATAAIDGETDGVEESLYALVDRSLIKEIDHGRFRYHDLLLLHARQRAEWEESALGRSSAVRRMVEWYLDRAVAADLVLRPTRRRVGPRFGTQATETTFISHQAALRWLENERHNILLAIRSASDQRWDSLTWEFCEALWGFFLHTRHYGDWLEMHAMGIPAAQRAGDTVAEARLRTQLAAALTNLHRYDEAIRENHEALRLAEEAGDEFTRAAVLSELAGAAQGKGDLSGALTYLTRAKEIRDVIGTDRAVALCQRRIGEVLTELGRYEEAIAALLEAADAMSLLDRAQHARALTSLGSAYLRSGSEFDATPLLTNALETARQLGSAHYEAEALVVLGDVVWQRGETDAAREHWTVAHAIYSANDDPKAAELVNRLKRTPSPRNNES